MIALLLFTAFTSIMVDRTVDPRECAPAASHHEAEHKSCGEELRDLFGAGSEL